MPPHTCVPHDSEYRDAEGNVFMRYVSRAPATRIDAIATQVRRW